MTKSEILRYCDLVEQANVLAMRRISALEAQLDRYRWRRVEKEMPEDETYMQVIGFGGVQRARYMGEGEWFDEEGNQVLDVIRWMPLPEPPKEKE